MNQVLAFRIAVVSTPMDDLLVARGELGVDPAKMRDKNAVIQGALDWLVNELKDKLPEAGYKHSLVVAAKFIRPKDLKQALEKGGDDDAGGDDGPGAGSIKVVGG